MAIIFLNFWKKRKFVIWKILLHETLIPEMWKQVLRNTEPVLIGLMDIYRVQLICQAQSFFRLSSIAIVHLRKS